jgi:S1-C subfamily serine protease
VEATQATGADTAVAAAHRPLARVDLSSNDGPAGAVVRVVTPTGAGSGVVLDRDGHLLTNWHVVRGVDRMMVYFKRVGSADAAHATRSQARILAHSKFSDLALLKVETLPPGLTPPAIAAEIEIRAGAPIHAIGHTGDGRWQHLVATAERVRPNSSWYSTDRVLHRADVIRAALSGASDLSGAPLFNDRLELIGLGAMMRDDKGELVGVSADTIRAFLGPPG